MKRLLAVVTQSDLLALFWCSMIALFAGLLKAMVRRTKRTTWREMIAQALTSASVGFAVGSTLRYTWGPERDLLIFPIVSVSGWIGTELYEMVAEWAKRQVKAWLNDPSHDYRNFPEE